MSRSAIIRQMFRQQRLDAERRAKVATGEMVDINDRVVKPGEVLMCVARPLQPGCAPWPAHA